MTSARFPFALLAIGLIAICVNRYTVVSAANGEELPDTLQQRVDDLETQVHQLRQLVVVLQAEQLHEMLPVQESAIIGEWVAKADNHQTIALNFQSNGRCDIVARDKQTGAVHGTGTWSLNEMQVVCSYRYDGQNDLPKTELPLDLISKDAMAFAGIVYRRSTQSKHKAN